MLRIILIAIISLSTAIIPWIIIAGIEDDDGPLFLLYIYIMIVGNYLLPTLLAAFIFYLFIKRIRLKKITLRVKWLTGALFILTCELALHLWAIGEWLISGNLTWDNFKSRYNIDFIGGNYPILIGGTLMTYLYFIGFLSSLNSSPRPIQDDRITGNE